MHIALSFSKAVWVYFIVIMSVSSCSLLTSASHQTLENTYWRLDELYDQPITQQKYQIQAHLIFSSSNQIKGNSGCNNLFGQYTRVDSTLSFSQVASTLMACTGSASNTEFKLMELLSEPVILIIKGNKMVFFTPQHQPIAQFTSVKF